jgi:hypothetical protein
MALADVRHEVVHMLAQTHEAQRDARVLRVTGGDRDKVMAAGELKVLARLEALLKARLDEIDRRAAEKRTLFSWPRQVWFDLMLNFESWIAHG